MVEVGDPSGTAIARAADAADSDVAALARAVEKGGKPQGRERAASAAIGDVVDEASEVTAKVERAVALFKGVAEGKVLDPEQLSTEIDAMLGLLERLDRQGRWREALRLARALSGLLALLMRWSALARSLAVGLQAAQRLDDLGAIAWAKHELGTLQLAAEEASGAERNLREAREIRERLGDQRGLDATDRNLNIQCEQLRELLREGKLLQKKGLLRRVSPRRLALATLAAVVLAGAGVAAGVVGGDGDGGGSPSDNRGGGGGDEGVVGDGQSGAGTGSPGGGGEEPNELTVSVVGSGTVTSDPAGVDCGKLCAQGFPSGTSVELTPAPAPEAVFEGWSGDCSGTGPCSVSLDEPRSVTASFAPDECHDGEDNDGDGLVDAEEDPGCADGTEEPPEPIDNVVD